jgi:hypothetical protein
MGSPIVRAPQRRNISPVLTNKPHIVIARPPRRIRKAAKLGPKITRVIVGPREPEAKPAAVIVGRKVATDVPAAKRYHAPAEAAERLWKELVRRVKEGR